MPIVITHAEQPLEEWRPGNKTRLLISEGLGATQLCVGEQWFEPGSGAPLHRHPGVEELITIVSGSADFTLNGEHVRLEAGQSILIPPDAVHGFVVREPLHLWGVFASATGETVFEEGEVWDIGSAGAEPDSWRLVKA